MFSPFQQQQRNINPNAMHRSPNNFMFPQRDINRQGIQAPNPGRNNIQGLLQRFIHPQSGGAMGVDLATKGAGGLSKTLDNVQQVLKVVQSTAPMIQEYGPMVKNLPAMYRMMKAFKDVGDDESTNNEEESVASNHESKDSNTTENETVKPKKSTGESTPKLFF